MSETSIIRRQRSRNMLYNLVAFTIIFVTFGSIIFNQVKASLYSKLDSELRTSLSIMKKRIADKDIDYTQKTDMAEGSKDDLITYPRIIPIIRDLEGKVVNFGSVNDSYYEQYLKYLDFDKMNPDIIVPLRIRNEYYFRSITTSVKAGNGEEMYIQLVINADSEQALLNHIGYILSICIAVFIILSILASYILSQKTMKPIRKSWRKQVEFVENVSHELRTPLTIVQNSLEMLLTTPHEKIIDRSESIALALNETTRLSKLVTDMLTLTRSDSTMTEITKDLFSIDVLVETVCEPYAELAESQNKIFNYSLNCPANIYADRGRIHQLLVILLDNALKYTNENDRITVTTSLKDNKTFITVADTGIGIADESMGKIFDRFYREDKARSREREGTGLGLSIASWIVDKHGGTIKVKRNEPKGTVFTVRLQK
jgi:two-component system, OmpR family, sensor histidine kinase CiaH